MEALGGFARLLVAPRDHFDLLVHQRLDVAHRRLVGDLQPAELLPQLPNGPVEPFNLPAGLPPHIKALDEIERPQVPSPR